MGRYLILFALLLALAASFAVHLLIRRIIDPRRSFVFFLLFIILHLASVFVIVWTFGTIVLRFATQR